MMSAPHDPGTEAALARSGQLPGGVAAQPISIGTGKIRVGTASWTDPTITAPGIFYPTGTNNPEERLRYYADQFSVVEVNTTYYAIPQRNTVENWAARTPESFVFDVKAHALMTGQPTEPKRLPPYLFLKLPEDLKSKSYIYRKDLPAEMLDQVYEDFTYSIDALRHKLGAVFLQFPKWVTPSGESYELIAQNRQRLSFPLAVEFRHQSWMDEKNAKTTLSFLKANNISYVAVDEPQGFDSSVPPTPATTSTELAVFRFHGRNSEKWDAQNISAAERFRYLYSQEELSEWSTDILAAAGQSKETHVIFNNCYANYGTTNALEMAEMLKRSLERH